jgi:hypothetical protein
VDQTDLTSHIPAPAAGNSPVSYFLTPQYAGNVQWRAAGTRGGGGGGILKLQIIKGSPC